MLNYENPITTGRAAVSNIINETARPPYILFKSKLVNANAVYIIFTIIYIYIIIYRPIYSN